jgi:UDP-glucuronate 4-epimerase
MALFLCAGHPEREAIELFNEGKMKRAFTTSTTPSGGREPSRKPPRGPAKRAARSGVQLRAHRIVNIGNPEPVELLRCVALLEECLGRTAVKKMLPMQPGDVEATAADTSDLERLIGSPPGTPLDVGIRRFVDWYRAYYSV